jgi:hypothetical protein
MTITQETSSRPDFREQAKVNDVPIAHLIGFKAEEIGEGRAVVTLAAGPQRQIPWAHCTAVFSATSRMPQWAWRSQAL